MRYPVATDIAACDEEGAFAELVGVADLRDQEDGAEYVDPPRRAGSRVRHKLDHYSHVNIRSCGLCKTNSR
jgi:hypothetical protein